MTAEFDPYRDTYRETLQQSIDFIGQDADFFTEAKVRHLLRLAREKLGNLSDRRILDVGCGPGLTDRHLLPHFKQVEGTDVSAGMIERAATLNPQARYAAYDGKRLPYPDEAFDLAFAICVLHHVPPAQWPDFVQEMARVVTPGGMVLIFEHNPFNPLTRLAVLRCEFDRDAVLLHRSTSAQLLREAKLTQLVQRYIVFFPFRSTHLAKVEACLPWLPLGAQYMVAGVKP